MLCGSIKDFYTFKSYEEKFDVAAIRHGAIMKNSMKQYIYVAVLAILFLGLGPRIGTILDFEGRKYYTVDDTWIEDTGVLIQLDHGKYSGSKFSYVYNGREYSGYSHLNYSNYNAVLGERVVLKINPKYPDKYLPIAWNVVFVHGEATDTIVGTIVEISSGSALNKIDNIGQSHHFGKFEYTVNGQVIERTIDIPPYLENSPAIKVGAKFQVEYLVDNPIRGIMHFDRPRR